MGANETLYTVEVLSPQGRTRKFTNPLFLTPEGLLHAFPEDESMFFLGQRAAVEFANSYGVGMGWKTRTKASVHCSRRFQMWAERVKPYDDFKETRRPIRASFELFKQGGWPALRKEYSKPNALRLVKCFVREGYITEKEAYESRLVLEWISDFTLSELVPLLEQAKFHGCEVSEPVRKVILEKLMEMRSQTIEED